MVLKFKLKMEASVVPVTYKRNGYNTSFKIELNQNWIMTNAAATVQLQSLLLYQTSKAREGVIIDHDVIVIMPLGRFY